ncbi:MAG TPA: SIMPL domain-containing protein [Geminicoccaceae bacterium]
MRAATLVRSSLVVAALMLAPVPALAQEDEREDDRGTRVVLDEVALREVEQDTLVAVLAARGEAANPRDAQAEVNEAIQDAIEQAEAVPGVRRATGGYRVYQEYDREGQPTGWVAEQDLRLTASEPAGLLDLAGRLQEGGLLLQGLAYELSRDARESLEDELTAEALSRLRQRADKVAEALGGEVERLLVLRVGSVDSPPPIMPRMMEMRAMAEDAMPPPSALPDLETVSVRVEGEVRLTSP